MPEATILHVDDSATVRRFTKEALEESGHRVVTTDKVWIARFVQQLEPDLVLMDVHMGATRSGAVVVEALNQLSLRQRMRVYFYSSRPEKELIELTHRFAADGYICKTRDTQALRDAVENALGTGPGRSFERIPFHVT